MRVAVVILAVLWPASEAKAGLRQQLDADEGVAPVIRKSYHTDQLRAEDKSLRETDDDSEEDSDELGLCDVKFDCTAPGEPVCGCCSVSCTQTMYSCKDSSGKVAHWGCQGCWCKIKKSLAEAFEQVMDKVYDPIKGAIVDPIKNAIKTKGASILEAVKNGVSKAIKGKLCQGSKKGFMLEESEHERRAKEAELQQDEDDLDQIYNGEDLPGNEKGDGLRDKICNAIIDPVWDSPVLQPLKAGLEKVGAKKFKNKVEGWMKDTCASVVGAGSKLLTAAAKKMGELVKPILKPILDAVKAVLAIKKCVFFPDKCEGNVGKAFKGVAKCIGYKGFGAGCSVKTKYENEGDFIPSSLGLSCNQPVDSKTCVKSDKKNPEESKDDDKSEVPEEGKEVAKVEQCEGSSAFYLDENRVGLRKHEKHSNHMGLHEKHQSQVGSKKMRHLARDLGDCGGNSKSLSIVKEKTVGDLKATLKGELKICPKFELEVNVLKGELSVSIDGSFVRPSAGFEMTFSKEEKAKEEAKSDGMIPMGEPKEVARVCAMGGCVMMIAGVAAKFEVNMAVGGTLKASAFAKMEVSGKLTVALGAAGLKDARMDTEPDVKFTKPEFEWSKEAKLSGDASVYIGPQITFMVIVPILGGFPLAIFPHTKLTARGLAKDVDGKQSAGLALNIEGGLEIWGGQSAKKNIGDTFLGKDTKEAITGVMCQNLDSIIPFFRTIMCLADAVSHLSEWIAKALKVVKAIKSALAGICQSVSQCLNLELPRLEIVNYKQKACKTLASAGDESITKELSCPKDLMLRGDDDQGLDGFDDAGMR